MSINSKSLNELMIRNNSVELVWLALSQLPPNVKDTILNQVWGMVYFALSQNETKE